MKLLPILIPLAAAHQSFLPHQHKPSTLKFLKKLYSQMDEDRNGKLNEADKSRAAEKAMDEQPLPVLGIGARSGRMGGPGGRGPGGRPATGRSMGGFGMGLALPGIQAPPIAANSPTKFIKMEDDSDGDGSLDFDEFVNSAFESEELKYPLAFSDKDKNGDGGLTLYEFMPPGLLNVLAHSPQTLKALEIGVMKKLDPDASGEITFGEYLTLVNEGGGVSEATQNVAQFLGGGLG